jgi:osmoprotectant transport system ATP-binding protein
LIEKSTDDVIIRFSGVTKHYEKTLALDNLDLDIHRGEFLTIIGGSGGGKTTLIKLVNGLLEPDSGTVYVGDEDVSTMDKIALRRKIGYSIQGIGLFPHMSVAKNIAYVPSLSKLWDKETERKKVAELLEKVGLEPEMAKRYPSELSGGQRQRVGLARALAAGSEILLMDEPFGAVDEITRRALQDEMLRIHQEISATIIFVTHDISEALKLGSRVLVIDNGQAVQYDTPEEIINNPATEFVSRLIHSG